MGTKKTNEREGNIDTSPWADGGCALAVYFVSSLTGLSSVSFVSLPSSDAKELDMVLSGTSEGA